MFDEIASPSALLCAVIFVAAAVAKLQAPSSTKSSVAAFGLPNWVGPILAPVELLVAIALVLRPQVGGVLAILLLMIFSWLIVRTIRRGEAVRCGCFGGTDQRPVGTDTLVRNLFLLAAAGVAATATPGPATTPSLAAMLTVTGAATSAMLVVALVRTRKDVGTLFGQQLVAGETTKRANS